MSGPLCPPRITVQGSVVTCIARRLDLAPQLERILSDHFTRFTGVPSAVWVVNPRGLTSVTVCGHTIPVRAGWPADAPAWAADHGVAVVYPPFESTGQEAER